MPLWLSGLLVYFLYGIRHSKEGEGINTYSILMTSSEASKEPWGTMNVRDKSVGSKLPEATEPKPCTRVNVKQSKKYSNLSEDEEEEDQ